ncbi:ABC-F type ribosomal protection protein [Lysinibacillus louembei]|uniref:ABC-F type ribosomal protection protein n=1 Tax=Lysinibacillus louembei TaxID=1470088 RepID=A0ABZ0RVI0_9BACI|nr:ABC-F type ribosomal protection protein [Lysinibacillus louembei]WPK11216.1 ABC-F type ribosomal protection protein [Lysinibacillus louembei]
MIELLKIHDVTLEFEQVVLLQNVRLSLTEGDVVGIVGKNGAGKSTLLHLLNGDMEPSTGTMQWQRHITPLYIQQEQETYDETSYANAELLAKWHVPDNDYSTLSGGEKLKLRLVAGFSKAKDLLLLDEPTNHLDDASIQLLIEQMKAYKGTIVVASHDRAFLDKVATKIWAIENKEIRAYHGNYTYYKKVRADERKAQQHAYEQQQKKIERIEGQLTNLTSWSNKAHAQSTKQEGFKEYHRVKAKRTDSQIKSKRKRLEQELKTAKVEQVAKPYEVQFEIHATAKRGKRFLEATGIEKRIGNKLLFKAQHFTIMHGEKVALIGPNGAGKTTFLQMVMGKEAYDGKLWLSPTASIGYLSQNVFDLPLMQTPAQIFHRATFEDRSVVQHLMKQLGFTAVHWENPIDTMSMGERVKLKLMQFILQNKDVLLLDEPTNHLDMESREQLEATLQQFTGTILAVSHDQYFLQQITDEQLIIEDGRLKKHVVQQEIQQDNSAVLLALETERQAVLGKLSLAQLGSEQYMKLDQRFNELTKEINVLKTK